MVLPTPFSVRAPANRGPHSPHAHAISMGLKDVGRAGCQRICISPKARPTTKQRFTEPRQRSNCSLMAGTRAVRRYRFCAQNLRVRGGHDVFGVALQLVKSDRLRPEGPARFSIDALTRCTAVCDHLVQQPGSTEKSALCYKARLIHSAGVTVSFSLVVSALLSLATPAVHAAQLQTDSWATQIGYRAASYRFSQIPTASYEEGDIYPTSLESEAALVHGVGLDHRWWSAKRPALGLHFDLETLFTQRDETLFCQADTDPCPAEAVRDLVSSSTFHGMIRKTFALAQESYVAAGMGPGMSDLQIVSLIDGEFGTHDSWISTVSFQAELGSRLTESFLLKLRVRQQLADFLVTPYSLHLRAEGNLALSDQLFLSVGYGFENRGMDSTVGDVSTSTLENVWHGGRIGLGFQGAPR